MNRDELIDITTGGKRTGPPSRREAMHWVMAAVAASTLPGASQDGSLAQQVVTQEQAAKIPDPTGRGYGTDPKLVKSYVPGELWPLTFTPAQKFTAAILADVIIPKDALGPAASEVGVVEMIDEWVSAPYPQQKADRPVVLDGLAWIENESKKRFGKPFTEVADEQRRAICDDVCDANRAAPQNAQAARFFARFRSLCAAAYYATPAGWQAIGYVGNVALEKFDGPPAEVLQRLGVTQTVI